MLPIRRVFDHAHQFQPSLTPAAFLQAVKAADDSGQVLLEPFAPGQRRPPAHHAQRTPCPAPPEEARQSLHRPRRLSSALYL
ncbi:MAG: hypothetical protein K9N47_11700 [Prosthecobacter sp.]|uniref:hypothetical protein n=1 Tax=Prosthecobacter sp. TaxID=1965333 RepID=UPI0025D0E909|nr:hypothetical protein [Prosthecobacter sp.]MCF7786779.1 hypothetical protein [Prosthecobacter sp.]